MDAAKDEKNKKYYKEGIQQLLMPEENLDNYNNIHIDYKNAYSKKIDAINKLYDEIKIIKKLKI